MILKKFHKVLEVGGKVYKPRRWTLGNICIHCDLNRICDLFSDITDYSICDEFCIDSFHNFENDTKKIS